jgi:phage/conjugal plasmid C-4 type zinc finger TraR family protein
MSDFIDDTAEREDALHQQVIANRVRYTGVSETHCVECGESIPQGRREAVQGVKLCVECAL